jgi:hypothetical protein
MRKFVSMSVGCAALALGACSTASMDKVYTPGFWVEPGKYQFLKCPDLAKKATADAAREKELVGLMDRANQESVGPFVNLMVYRSDLEQVRADQALLQQTAHEKGCDNPATAPAPAPASAAAPGPTKPSKR